LDQLEGQKCLAGTAFPEEGPVAGLPEGQTLALVAKQFHQLNRQKETGPAWKVFSRAGPEEII
jgi:hypothetical protein